MRLLAAILALSLAGCLVREGAVPKTAPASVQPGPRLIDAGAALTWLGSALSIGGSSAFATARESDRDLRLASGIVAGVAEPIMISGTVLWILGALRPAKESRPERAR